MSAIIVDTGAEPLISPAGAEEQGGNGDGSRASLAVAGGELWEWAFLVSPFFFWGTAMVAMKGVIPRTGPFFVAAVRLLPAGALLVAFAAARGRKQPSGWIAWLAVAAFGLVDAACFQGFLAQGLQKTSAGLGSVIIDSQPLTVAVLASLLYGESIGAIGAGGLVLGVIGLLLLEVPALSVDGNDSTIWGSGQWWMFLSAQSMAVGTIMVRWVSKYTDPIMATGWVCHGRMNKHSLHHFALCFLEFKGRRPQSYLHCKRPTKNVYSPVMSPKFDSIERKLSPITEHANSSHCSATISTSARSSSNVVASVVPVAQAWLPVPPLWPGSSPVDPAASPALIGHFGGHPSSLRAQDSPAL